MLLRRTSVAVLLLAAFPLLAQTATTYQKPPEAIERLLTAPLTPQATPSPDRKLLLIAQPATFPSIADLAQPRYRLAGIRFNPATSGPSREVYSVSLSLQPVGGGSARPIAGLPAKLKASDALWSPDSRHIAFMQIAPAASELWIVDIASGRAHRLGVVRLNSILGRPCAWMPDSSALLCKTVASARGPAPSTPLVPTGPNVEQNLGKVSPGRTYEDMLKTPADASIFEYYATSQLAEVSLSGAVHLLPSKGLLLAPTPSPDGRFALVESIHRPFSYTLPYERYPRLVTVVTLRSGVVKKIDDQPLLDNLPIARDAVQPGPRNYQWQGAAPSTLVWIQAADGGDPRRKVEIHDRLLALDAPFTGTPRILLEAPLRLRTVDWGTAHVALAGQQRFRDRREMLVAFDPAAPGKTVPLYDGSSQDRYHSPGRPLLHTGRDGASLLDLTPDGSAIYFVSPGSTPRGDQPFIASMPIAGGNETILFRSADPFYAEPLAVLDKGRVLVRRESPTEPPNFYSAALNGGPDYTQITRFPSPYAGIALPTHRLLRYKRADGVDLSATLWLPAGYDLKTQGPLPTLMEAYPAEFKDRAAAAEVSGSPNRFPRISWASPVFFTADGYAVLENASIPIVGEGSQQPNDTYVQQLVASAQAAIDAGVATGAVDRNRVAVMGHSYGAFMTANLLAHTSLFRAGIARSGAYNRTLTPYGFQNEERTYWQDPQLYYQMSPFSYADKVKTPILLIHGEADDNQGTFPIQSERFYEALKGQGATVRLVWLPLEAHGYQARESLQHMLWEMDNWLNTYDKPAIP